MTISRESLTSTPVWCSRVQQTTGAQITRVLQSCAFAVIATCLAGCDSGGQSTASVPGASAAGTPCQERIQESLSTYGTPDEIRDDSVTFDDGSMMLIESHIYTGTRLVISFGHEVEKNNCVRWEEGLTI